MSATVILDNIKIELTTDQIIEVFRQLPPTEQEKVRRALTHEEWERRFRDLLARIWARLDTHPISDDEIDEEIRIVRGVRRARPAPAESSG